MCVMRVADGYLAACEVGRGVGRGCSLSPLLFISYSEAMMGEADGGPQDGVSVGGHIVSALGCEDDGAAVPGAQREMRSLMDGLRTVAEGVWNEGQC